MKSSIDRLPVSSTVGTLILAVPEESRVRIGARAGEHTDPSEPFLGLEKITPLSPRRYFNPKVELSAVEHGELITLIGDQLCDFEIGTAVKPWGGEGLAVTGENRGGRSERQRTRSARHHATFCLAVSPPHHHHARRAGREERPGPLQRSSRFVVAVSRAHFDLRQSPIEGKSFTRFEKMRTIRAAKPA